MGQDLLILRESSGLMFRVHQPTIDFNIIDSTASADEFHGCAGFFLDYGRQTGGLG